MYALFTTVYAVVALWGLPRVRMAYHKFLLNRAQRKHMGQKSSVVQNRALMTLILHVAVTTPLALMLGIIELSSPLRVGVDVLPTIVFVLFRSMIYFETFLYQPFMLTVLLGKTGEARTALLLKNSDRYAAVIFFFIGLAGFLSIVSLCLQTPQVTVWTYVSYQVIVGICMIGLCFQAFLLDRHIRTILDASTKLAQSAVIADIRTKMSRFQRGAKIQTGFQAVFSLTMGCVPYLMGFYGYILPITFLFPTLVWINAVKAQAQVRTESASGKTSANGPGGGGGTEMSSVRKKKAAQADSSYVSENAHRDHYELTDNNLWEPVQASSNPASSFQESEMSGRFGSSVPPPQPSATNLGPGGGVMEIKVALSPMARVMQAARSLTPKRKGENSGQFSFDDKDAEPV